MPFISPLELTLDIIDDHDLSLILYIIVADHVFPVCSRCVGIFIPSMFPQCRLPLSCVCVILYGDHQATCCSLGMRGRRGW